MWQCGAPAAMHVGVHSWAQLNHLSASFPFVYGRSGSRDFGKELTWGPRLASWVRSGMLGSPHGSPESTQGGRGLRKRPSPLAPPLPVLGMCWYDACACCTVAHVRCAVVTSCLYVHLDACPLTCRSPHSILAQFICTSWANSAEPKQAGVDSVAGHGRQQGRMLGRQLCPSILPHGKPWAVYGT